MKRKQWIIELSKDPLRYVCSTAHGVTEDIAEAARYETKPTFSQLSHLLGTAVEVEVETIVRRIDE